MLPSPSELEYFLEISNTKNMSRAAERLGVSQPTLSLAIKRLEDCFGLPLLIRSKSGVRLTLAGEKLVENVRSLLESWENIKNEAQEDETTVRGNFKIGCHVSVGLYSLAHFMPDLLNDYSQVEVTLSHDLSRKITEDVISFKSDFGIVVNPVAHPDLIIKKIAKDIVSLWTSHRNTDMQNLNKNPVLICDSSLNQTQDIMKKLKKSINFKRIITSVNLEIIASLTATGCGIGILPSRVATRLSEYKLKSLGPNYPKFNDQICLIYRNDTQKSRSSRVLSKYIEERLVKHLN